MCNASITPKPPFIISYWNNILVIKLHHSMDSRGWSWVEFQIFLIKVNEQCIDHPKPPFLISYWNNILVIKLHHSMDSRGWSWVVFQIFLIRISVQCNDHTKPSFLISYGNNIKLHPSMNSPILYPLLWICCKIELEINWWCGAVILCLTQIIVEEMEYCFHPWK